ncbi:hypothetical protein F2Q69_00017691 [Brassica cretica]|uniref:F-box associated beta-propeller type 3 domain-containing protein n=1 Tax=Brassica cretica TaxID=69181 RepID=A0A8S9R7P1_BRACR|nr:hypothetical protein F2Q69_00017691 [Brassica cretica]
MEWKWKAILDMTPLLKSSRYCLLRDDGKELHVLTLGTNRLSWRAVECCTPHCSSGKWICISGVLYYIATESGPSSGESMVVCFDLRSEKFSSVTLLGGFNKALPHSTTMINYNGRLGLLTSSENSGYASRSCKSFKLWVLRDAATLEWSKRVYVLC